jgi:hypothetical protein
VGEQVDSCWWGGNGDGDECGLSRGWGAVGQRAVVIEVVRKGAVLYITGGAAFRRFLLHATYTPFLIHPPATRHCALFL